MQRLKLARLVLGICLALMALTGLRDKIVGFSKLNAVHCFPKMVVAPCMGWDIDRVNANRIYYRDGFHRACTGRGFKCLPPTFVGAQSSGVKAWTDGFLAGRESGGEHAPPESMRPFVEGL